MRRRGDISDAGGDAEHGWQLERAANGGEGTEPTQPDFVRLYRQAFEEYGARALWNKRVLEEPTREDVLVVARALRVEGNRDARRLAEQIERACRAVL